MPATNLLVILGPTASGKTNFGSHLSFHIGGEIISADSRQVYRKMDIGTGKDYQDYLIHGRNIPYHLVDIHDPGYKYNVYEFQNDFIRVFREIRQRGNFPVMVGGTGMYIQAVLDKYELIHVPVNPPRREELEKKTLDELVHMLKSYRTQLHNTTDLVHRKRTIRAIEIAEYYQDHPAPEMDFPEIHPIIIGIRNDPEERRKKISERLINRMEEGLADEVSGLLKTVSREDLIFYGLEYKMVTLYLTGELTYSEMIRKLETAIHQFAKRQMTWFRRMEKSGYKIHWIDGRFSMDEKLDLIQKLLFMSDKKFPGLWKK
jgi:tRNA dimethylallyltransferase